MILMEIIETGMRWSIGQPTPELFTFALKVSLRGACAVAISTPLRQRLPGVNEIAAHRSQ